MDPSKHKFLSLEDLNLEKIKKQVDLPELFNIIEVYINNCDTPKDEILIKSMEFIVEKLLLSYELNEELLEYLEPTFTNLYRLLEIIIDSISRQQRTIENSKLIELIDKWYSLFVLIENKEPKLRIFGTLIKNGLQFLYKNFALYTDLENQSIAPHENEYEDMEKLLNGSVKLHKKAIEIIENKMELLKCQVKLDSYIISEILLQLFNIAKIAVDFNAIICTTTLKSLLNLAKNNASFLESQLDRNNEWIEATIRFCCDQIQFLLCQFFESDFLEQNDEDEILKYLKFCVFYVKYLGNIAEKFDNVNGFKYIIAVFYNIQRLKKILDSETFQLIDLNLNVELVKLLSRVYKCEDFIEELLQKETGSEDDEGFAVLGLEILKLLARYKDEYSLSIYFYGKFIQKLYSKAFKSSELFLISSNYKSLQASTIALLLLYHENSDLMKEFESILAAGILQFHFQLTRICFEIWSFLIRTVDKESCYEYFCFWTNILESFPVDCTDPRKVPVKWLIKICYNALPEFHRAKIWSQSDFDKILLLNTLDQGVAEKFKSSFISSKEEELIEMLKMLITSNTFTFEDYTNLIGLFKFFSNQKISKNKSIKFGLPELIIMCMKIIFYQPDYYKHELFFNTLIQFLTNNIFLFNGSEITFIRQSISEALQCSLKLSTKLFFNKMLKTLEKSSVSDSNKFVDQILSHYKSKSMLNVDIQTYLTEKLTTFQFSNCPIMWDCKANIVYVDSNEVEKIEQNHLSKRLKLDDEVELSEDYQPVQTALTQAREISEHFKSNRITLSDANCLKEIISLYSNILK